MRGLDVVFAWEEDPICEDDMTNTTRAGRNELCPCGSGKKFKKCCALKQTNRGNTVMLIVVGVLMAAGVVAGITAFTSDRNHVARPAGVWSAEHGHYH